MAAPELFRQFDDGVPEEELGLPPVKVDTWGGWLWFNMDLDACPLRDYLGDIGTHLETYEFEQWQLIDYQTFEWAGNWKHAVAREVPRELERGLSCAADQWRRLIRSNRFFEKGRRSS